MTSPISGLAATVYGALKNIFLDATLTRQVVLDTSPAYDPLDPPAPTPVTYTCKAIRDKYSSFDKLNTNIGTSDSKILILADSLAVTPIGNDIITIQGASFLVISVDVDPANAVWTIQGRQ